MNTPRACHATLKHAELTAVLKDLAAQYPHLVELNPLTRSREGREVWQVTVGDRRIDAEGPDAHGPHERPAVYVDANIHACELTGSTACLTLIHELCEASSTPEGATRLIETTFYVIPRVSPDGAEHFLNTGEYVRSSPQLYPHEDLPRGLHARDLDGDGIVAQMRIEDPAGGWRVSKSDARVMVRRTPVDTDGPFYRVYPEGELHDFDGHVIKEAPRARGLDLNRNFPAAWKGERDQKGAGAFPLSEPETRAVAEFIREHRNIGVFLALHTGIEVLIPPEASHSWTDYDEDDRVLIQQLAAPGVELLKMPFESLYQADYGKIYGDFSEWIFEHQGIPGFVAEIWSPASRAGYSLKDQLKIRMDFEPAEPMDLAVARWLDAQNIPGQLKPWVHFDHPQLGKVELGGWRQGFYSQAPDGEILEEIGQRVSRYVQVLARALPRLELRSLDVTSIAPGLYRVGATVINAGMMATNLTNMALDVRVAREVEAKLELSAGVERVVGLERQKLGHLEGYGGMGRAEWLVRGPEGAEITLRIDGSKGGRLARRTTLG